MDVFYYADVACVHAWSFRSDTFGGFMISEIRWEVQIRINVGMWQNGWIRFQKCFSVFSAIGMISSVLLLQTWTADQHASAYYDSKLKCALWSSGNLDGWCPWNTISPERQQQSNNPRPMTNGKDPAIVSLEHETVRESAYLSIII